MTEQKPVLDQYYPGGAAQQALDWNLEQHEAVAGGASDPVAGNGYLQIGPVIQNWGTITSLTGTETITFQIPFTAVPTVTGSSDSNVQLVNITTTGVTLKASNAGAKICWFAVGI